MAENKPRQLIRRPKTRPVSRPASYPESATPAEGKPADGQAARKPAPRSGAKPGDKPAAKPGARPGVRPGGKPAAQGGARPAPSRPESAKPGASRAESAKPGVSRPASARPAAPPRSPAPPAAPPSAAVLALPPDSLALQLQLAAELLERVRQEGETLTQALPALWARYPQLPAAGRAAVQDLIYSTLRAHGRGDALLARLLSKPLPGIVHAILLVALQRLDARPELAHTTVDQAVRAVGCHVEQLKPVANGVLRRYLREQAALQPDPQKNPAAHWCHPDWWVRALQSAHPACWQDILAAGNQHPPMTLRANRRRIDAATLAARLQAAGHACRVVGADAVLLDTPRPLQELPGFAEGLFSVQDLSAQQAAPWLDLQPGQRVLDACAAPGGKSAHILECADVELLALELDPLRARRIEENLQRLQLNARVQVADCTRLPAWWDGRPFDRILADLPCSASGVARRQPDIKWLRRASDIATFARQQAVMLHALWQTLAPGGKMLYVTCSVFEEENSQQIARFAAAHGDARRLPLDGQPEQQLLPDASRDGFYYALLQKHA